MKERGSEGGGEGGNKEGSEGESSSVGTPSQLLSTPPLLSLRPAGDACTTNSPSPSLRASQGAQNQSKHPDTHRWVQIVSQPVFIRNLHHKRSQLHALRILASMRRQLEHPKELELLLFPPLPSSSSLPFFLLLVQDNNFSISSFMIAFSLVWREIRPSWSASSQRWTCRARPS